MTNECSNATSRYDEKKERNKAKEKKIVFYSVVVNKNKINYVEHDNNNNAGKSLCVMQRNNFHET